MSGYGATEMASSMVMYRPGVLDDLEKQKMTVGRVRKPIQVKIIDDDGKELRVVQTQAILFFEINVGKRRIRHRTTLNLNSKSILIRSRISSFNFSVVLCRIRLFPSFILKINWLGSELPLS